MLKKDGSEWSDEVRKAFEDLKRAMTRTSVLAWPDFKKPFEFYINASGEGIGVVLAHD